MANRYWIGGSGTWAESAHWSDTSGGTGGLPIPTSADDVFFDANSFTATGQYMNIASSASCRTMDWTGALYSPAFTLNQALSVFGHLIFTQNMTLTGPGGRVITLAATGGTWNITTNGMIVGVSLTIGTGTTGTPTWNLTDHLTLDWVNNKNLSHVLGRLFTNGFNVICSTYSTATTTQRTLNLGASYFTARNGFSIGTGANFVFNAGTSTIEVGITGAGFLGFSSTNRAYYNVLLSSCSNVTGSGNTFNKLMLSGQLSFSSGSIHTATIIEYKTDPLVNASFTSATAGVPFTLRQTTPGLCTMAIGGTVRDCTCDISTGASYLSIGSTNVSSNSSITFEDTRRYWVSGTGSWSEGGQAGRWAYLSGVRGTAPAPTATMDVYFDENSFTAPGQVVNIDTTVNCRLWDTTGALYNPTFKGTANINVFGNIAFTPNMSFAPGTGGILTLAGTSQTIDTKGVPLLRNLNILDNVTYAGIYVLLSDLNLGLETASINFYTGDFYTLGYKVSAGSFTIAVFANSLTLGNSLVDLVWDFAVEMTNPFTLNADTSTIRITKIGANSSRSGTFGGQFHNYNNVEINFPAEEFSGSRLQMKATNSFKRLSIRGDIHIQANTRQDADILEISTTEALRLKCATPGSRGVIRQNTPGNVVFSAPGSSITDIFADTSGGAQYLAYGVTDGGNNANIIFNNFKKVLGQTIVKIMGTIPSKVNGV